MKIFILKPVKEWEPWYDKAFGFVVSAESEDNARKIAQENGGDEVGYDNKFQVWTSPKLTTCKELKPDYECLVMRDFAAA